ncbi:Zn-ribbon domain-containing OB-fold protein [Mycobacterium branderi]|nr:OB-fold domain-containing protein [Mycobacterium branderi]MCV7231880.1 OB-fold domain-containing protein [Mycobacterium branderi]ORA40180.1 hypothetical protein BST20_06300 [Mycobacterium branderi]
MSKQQSAAIADPVPVEDLCPIEVVKTADDGRPCLQGSRCPICRQVAFPPRQTCSRCYHSSQEEVALGSEGSLYAFSTVHVSSTQAVPYTLGFVDLSDEIRVLGRLFGAADRFGIGDTVVLALRDDDWGFQKADAGAVSDG